MNKSARTRNQHGFALITAMLLVAVLAVMVTAYFMLTQIEMTTAASSQNSTSGFYAAEAGLNLRGQELRSTFLGFNQPRGASPENVSAEGKRACKAYTEDGITEENLGADDFRCVFYEEDNGNEIAEGRRVVTYVTEPNNPNAAAGQQQAPLMRELETGRFAGLNAQEFIYDVKSESYRVSDDEFPEAKLQTTFRSQVVPLFQFAAFYDQDLEIAPGQKMELAGRVHSNGDLYLKSSNLDILGDVTSAGKLYGGRKLKLESCGDSKVQGKSLSCEDGWNDGTDSAGYTNEEIREVWTDNEVQQDVPKVQVPEPKFLDRDPYNTQKDDYWEKADLRVVLKYSEFEVLGNTYKVAVPEVQDAEGKVMVAATNLIDPRNPNACANNPVDSSDTFFNNREGKDIRMLEIDMEALLACIDQNANTFQIEDGLRNDSEGGLVFHFSVDDSAMKDKSIEDEVNNYGVRVKNGAELDNKVKGLTVATNQAMYVQGDYNSNDKKKKPASFLADSLNILSNDWKDLTDDDGNECFRRDSKCKDAEDRNMKKTRKAANTTVNAAFLAGVDDSEEMKNKNGYNGGLENYPRLHEAWGSDRTLKIRGSFVSLGEPKHVEGSWADSSYSAPKRDWNFDEDFLKADGLPPLSPRFVNLVQQLFTRSFEQNEWQFIDPELSSENEDY